MESALAKLESNFNKRLERLTIDFNDRIIWVNKSQLEIKDKLSMHDGKIDEKISKLKGKFDQQIFELKDIMGEHDIRT